LLPPEKIEEVLAAVDLAALIRTYVDLKRVGSSYKGLCPFHNEKTPSFYVTPEKGVFHCFGCGAGGNAINFMMMQNHLTFPEAVAELAQLGGVSLPAGQDSRGGPRVNKNALFEVMKKAAGFFQANLWENDQSQILAYLKKRGLNLDLARNFGLGLSRDSWDALHKFLNREGYNPEIQIEAGLVRPRRNDGGSGCYDLFRNRLMFPIWDAEGRIASLAGRVLETETNPDTAKFINSPTTPIHKKGHLLYGYHQARPHMRANGLVFLVEGYFDLLAMVQADVKNVVSSMGTALTQQQINLLKGQVRNVYLFFDGDEAGRKAASNALPALLNVELDGKVMVLPKEHDPDTFLKEKGALGIYEAASEAADILDYYSERLLEISGPTLAGQAKAIREAQEMLSQIPDAARGQLLQRKLAAKLGINSQYLVLGRNPPEKERDFHPPAASPRGAKINSAAMEIIRYAIIYPELAQRLSQLSSSWPDDKSRRIFDQLVSQAAGGTVEPEKIQLDGDDELASLVSGAILSERLLPINKAASIFSDLGEKLTAQSAKKQTILLNQQLKEAFSKGDDAEVRRLAEVKQAVPHRLSKMRPQ
jgi:DNA primase